MKGFLAVVASTMLLAAYPSDAFAGCSCSVDPVALTEKAGVQIFIATATNVRMLDPADGSAGDPRIEVELAVEAAWTELDTDFVHLHTFHSAYDCVGFWFEEDGRYLVIAIPNEDLRPMIGDVRGWPPTNTLGVLHCAVWEQGTTGWDTVSTELNQHLVRRIRGGGS
jgi:hypothetical protein